MADMFDLFMGQGNSDSEGGFVEIEALLSNGLEQEAKKKDQGKKKEKKKQVAKAQKGDVLVDRFPVTVRARGFCMQYGAAGDEPKMLSNIIADLVSQGYAEAAFGGILQNSIIYIRTPGNKDKSELDDRICEGCTVADGMTRMEVTAEDFHSDAEELSVDMVLERWIANNPIYEGCSLAVENLSATPVFPEQVNMKKELDLPIKVFYDGSEHTFSETDFSSEKVTAEDIVKRIYGEGLSGITISLQKSIQSDLFFPCIGANTGNFILAAGAPSHSEKQKAIEKYTLPLNVFVTTFGLSISLTADDFDGQKKVTLEEIKRNLAHTYKIFSDKSRRLDSVYIEESNTLSLMFVSGKKGAVRVERLPYGTFEGTVNRDGNVTSVSFLFQAAKIPMEIFKQIVSAFKRDMEKEASCRICYAGERYFVVDTTKSANKVSVLTEIPKELNHPSIVHVMDVHSHNTMPAFFSSVDDADEIWPGLFMVIGNLDCQSPTVVIRAGLEGAFVKVPFADIFEEAHV